MMNIWIKIVPLPTSEFGFSKEESEQILNTRTIIKEFGIGMQEHLKQLQNYLKELLRSKPLLQNYLEIQNFKSFQEFKELLLKAQGTSLVASKVEELIKETF